MNTPTDYRGQELSVGTLVAYNLSGNVVLGRIKSFQYHPSTRPYMDDRWSFKIEDPEGSGHVSSVRHQNSVMAIKEVGAKS